MYSDIKSCVSVNRQTSAYFPSFSVEREGENLSPILFSIYLNDLENFITRDNNGITLQFDDNDTVVYFKILILLYADDTVIVGEQESDFQLCLDNFFSYCQMWKLKINFSKTKIVVFGTNKPSKYSFSINGQTIEVVKEYKYLGIMFNASGRFISCMKNLVARANKAMHQLYIRIYNLDLPIDLQLKLFDHTVVPILTYGCEVWGFENTEIIEQVHANFLRKITKSKLSTPRYMLYAELGRYPIDIIIKTRMIKYWIKLLNMHDTKLSKICYKFMLNSDHPFKWKSSIKDILDSTGYSYYWLNQNNIHAKNIYKIIKQTLKDQFIQGWHSKLENSNKGKIYASFKSTTDREPYVTILPADLRLSLMHFRTANHRFPIETGRWHKSTLQLNSCKLCPQAPIGDEQHYLLQCPFFADQRSKLLPYHLLQLPIEDGFKILLNTTDEYLLINLSKLTKILINYFKNTTL